MLVKLSPNFTRHHLITHTNVRQSMRCFADILAINLQEQSAIFVDYHSHYFCTVLYFLPIYDWYIFNKFNFHMKKIIVEITETWKVSSSDVIFKFSLTQDPHDITFRWQFPNLWELRNP